MAKGWRVLHRSEEKARTAWVFALGDDSLAVLWQLGFSVSLGTQRVHIQLLGKDRQVNLHHNRLASAELSGVCCRLLQGTTDISLIQEPWIVKGKVLGINTDIGKIVYDSSHANPRTSVFYRNDVAGLPFVQFCSRDLTTV